ncbi:MAG: hypothetical protein LUC91_01385 [Prevotella sp.]|nr:hypothetical protein [Prevotella sp.]
MATKYSDFIHLQNFLPVYDMLEEGVSSWQSFIPTAQFNEMLQRTLTAITSNEVSKRRSIWLRGTFGTGKSHASAVVKHLLCDDFDAINSYIDCIREPALKSQVRNLRQNMRYFAVTLKGVEQAYDIPRFTLSLQREVSKAIKAVAPDFVVKSDFTTIINWIEKHRRIFEEEVIPNAKDLADSINTADEAITFLENYNPGMYITIENAIRETIGPVSEQTAIAEWLVEVEQEIEKRNIANGLIIFWDEFTSVMDTLKSDRINLLQNIAEKSQYHNVFLFLISHRLESQSTDNKAKDITRMSDRFDEIDYKMDSLSTYLIMRHSFTIPDIESNEQFKTLKNSVLPKIEEVLDFLTHGHVEQMSHIKELLPMHPYTAFLCSEISNFIGSSNRSVIKFMHDGESGFEAFLNNENCYNVDMLMTADTLWDFFYPTFDSDPASATFTGLFNSFEGKVRAQGEDYLRVFKSILLLNALSPKFKKSIELMTPNENVISHIYAGDRAHSKVVDILNFFDENKIVVRDIFGEFKIRGTSYNQNEMNKKRQDELSGYKTATAVLDYDVYSKEQLTNLFQIGVWVKRETVVQFFSCEDNEQLLRSRLNKFTSDKPNYMHVAFFLALDEESRESKTTLLQNFSKEFEWLVVVLSEEAFSTQYYNKFIDAVATSKVAKSHFNETESKEFEKAAHAFVSKWITQLRNNTYIVYFNGESFREGTIDQLPELLNNKLSGKAYPKGFEAHRFPKDVSVPMTFFSNKNCPGIIKQVLQAQNRDQLITFKGNALPLKYLFEENGNSLVKTDGTLSDNAVNGHSWLVEICRGVENFMEKARKEYVDKFSLPAVLAPFIRQPYGMSTSLLNCAAITYGLRQYKSELFQTSTSQPISDEALCDMVTELFKMWKEGKSEASSKMLLRFGSKEESELVQLLYDTFDLGRTIKAKQEEVKSLDNAKWYIQEFCKIFVKQPLWTLLYMPSLSEDLKNAISSLISIFSQDAPSVDKIKAIYRDIKNNHVELSILLTDAGNYEKGFVAFVEQIEGIKIEKSWWKEMLDNLSLPVEIGFHKESDVEKAIYQFYIKKTAENGSGGDKGGDNSVEGGNRKGSSDNDLGKTTPPQVDIIKQAKEKVKATNMPNTMWQMAILNLLEQYPETADFFNRL